MSDVSAYLNKAIDFQRRGQAAEAAALYRSVLALVPAHSDPIHLLGLLAKHQGDEAQAERLFRRAVALLSSFAEAHFNYARLLVEQKRVAEGLAVYRAGIRGRADYLLLYIGYARTLLDVNRAEEALQVGRQALALQPDSLDVHVTLALIHNSVNAFAAAEAVFERGCRIQPNSSPLRSGLGTAQMDQGKVAAAVASFNEALRLDPNDLVAESNLGMALGAAGDKEGALRIGWRTGQVHYQLQQRYSVQEADVDQILDAIDQAIPHPRKGPRRLVYIHSRIGALGHLALEAPVIGQLYRGTFDELVVLHPREVLGKRINRSIFDLVMRGATTVPTDDLRILGLSWRDIGIFHRGDTTYLLQSSSWVYRQLFNAVIHNDMPGRLSFSEAERERGAACQRRLGIPEDARIVVLHVRGSGYHPTATFFVYRDANIANYIETIRDLTRQGFVVVRIGDRTMAPLPDLGPQVIDAPFCDDYDEMMDAFFIAKAHFMISSLSGPHELARAFKVPTLTLNTPFSTDVPEMPGLLACKRYVDVASGTPRPIGMEELLDRQLHYVLYQEKFDRLKIRLEELAPHEVLEITREMVAFVEHRPPVNAARHRRFRELALREHRRALDDPAARVRQLDWFGYATPDSRLSEVFCDVYPEFLGMGCA